MRVSLRFQGEDENKSRETSAVALNSTKKWNFSKRKGKLGRYTRHSSYYNSSSTRCPAAPITQLDPPPPPPPADLATLYSKRKIWCCGIVMRVKRRDDKMIKVDIK